MALPTEMIARHPSSGAFSCFNDFQYVASNAAANRSADQLRNFLTVSRKCGTEIGLAI